METRIKQSSAYQEGSYRNVFDTEEITEKLKVYIKSKLCVYDVVLAKSARLEREEFCAARFLFTVIKDDTVSFNQGDGVSVKYDGKIIFYGYVFSKRRNKEGLIDVVCYDQMRYLKNRRSYTRGSMTLEEIVRGIAGDNKMATGEIEKTNTLLPGMAVDNISLLDVIVRACKEERNLSGKRYIVYDNGGYITLKNEENMTREILIDSAQAEDFEYTDTIDNNVYNMICLYNDTKRLNLREITTVSDRETMEKWGTLILSKKVSDENNSVKEAENLLKEYNRINREIILKGVAGYEDVLPGTWLWVKMVMGDLNIDGYVRCRKSVQIFEKNTYTTNLYIDGSEMG